LGSSCTGGCGVGCSNEREKAKGKLLQGDALRERVKKLGVSPWMWDMVDKMGQAAEPKLQRRVMEAERHFRNSKLWWIAFVSVLASLFSAIAAWYAVLHRSSAP